jgi:hypothetical protein
VTGSLTVYGVLSAELVALGLSFPNVSDICFHDSRVDAAGIDEELTLDFAFCCGRAGIMIITPLQCHFRISSNYRDGEWHVRKSVSGGGLGHDESANVYVVQNRPFDGHVPQWLEITPCS